MSEKFRLAELDLAGTSIPQMESDDGLSYEFSEFLQRQAGDASPAVTGVTMTSHKFNFETQHIQTIIDLCIATAGNENICQGFPSSGADQILTFRKGKSSGVRTPLATAEHIDQRVDASFLSWESFNAPADGNATISCRLQTLSALTNDKAAALSSVSVVDQAFKCGPIVFRITGDIADREPCVLSATWENNITYDDKNCSGSDFTNYSAIDDYESVLTIDLDDMTQAIDANASAALTSCVFYLKQVGEANGALKHIKFTVTAGDVLPSSNRQLKFRVRSFTIATDQAIV